MMDKSKAAMDKYRKDERLKYLDGNKNQAPRSIKILVASKVDAQVDHERDHKIVCWQDLRVKRKSRKVNQSWKLTEAPASRTGSPTQRLLPRTIQVVAQVAQSCVDRNEAGDTAVVAEVKRVKEVAAAAGKTVIKEGSSLVKMPGQLLEW